jgi:aspartyl-tRNA(Asn)/glutamyl-tRNA(Gln) amidotransferase subunit A
MTIEQWLEDGKSDAYRRKLPELADLLQGLSQATAALRAADWNDDASAAAKYSPEPLVPTEPADSRPAGASTPATPSEAGPTIAELSVQLASGAVRSERLTEDALAVIAARNPRLNAFIAITADEALARARDADREIAGGRYLGKLHGIPLSLKDIFDQAGRANTAASRLREGCIAERHAPIVSRLADAGAVFVGRTNLHEFALGTTTEDSGWGLARHPIDDTRSPGGSSGGSAIAVRSGMSIASVGTDTGGSIRIPSAACGIVGLKPGWGEIPADGVVPLSRQLDHVGPLARSVADAAIMYDVLRGAAQGSTSVGGAPLSRLSFAALGGYFMDRLATDVEAGIRQALDTLRTQGARVGTASIAHAKDIAPVYLHLVLADAAAYHAVTLDRRPHAYTANVRLRLEMGRHILAEDYERALRGREVLRHDVESALQGVDALLLPALGIEAPPIGAATVPVNGGQEPVRTAMLRCTQLFNVTSHPAISLPCGTTRAGLPIGLQIVGHPGRTGDLLRAAAAVERALLTTR